MVQDLFGDKTPTGSDYPSTQLFSHLKELEWACGDNDNIRTLAEDYLIDGRSHALNSIHEGLTLDDEVELRHVFAAGDLQLIDKILSSSPQVTAELIIQNLGSNKIVDGNQQKIMDETLPDLLRKKEQKSGPEYLRAFLKHVTGLSYMNRGNPKIVICFESLADGYKMALPEAHTCEQELVFSLGAYDANVESLEYYLDRAIQESAVEGLTEAKIIQSCWHRHHRYPPRPTRIWILLASYNSTVESSSASFNCSRTTNE